MIAGCSLKKALFFGHFGRRYEWLTLVPHRDFGDWPQAGCMFAWSLSACAGFHWESCFPHYRRARQVHAAYLEDTQDSREVLYLYFLIRRQLISAALLFTQGQHRLYTFDLFKICFIPGAFPKRFISPPGLKPGIFSLLGKCVNFPAINSWLNKNESVNWDSYVKLSLTAWDRVMTFQLL